MSWVTIIWSMIASACLTLAALHLLVWFKKLAAWSNLLFALAAAGTAGTAFCELWLMHAQTAGEYGMAIRWGHLPYWVSIISLVGFVRLYMRAGRLWLAWMVCGLRTLSLILDFVSTPNLNYREITALRHLRFLGESVSVAVGIPNPWMLVGQTSLLLLLVFLVDAALTIWRRGERRSMLILSITMMFFFAMGMGQFVFGFWGIMAIPPTPSLFFMGVVAAMGYDLSSQSLRAEQLSMELRESEERMTMAAEAAAVGVWMWSIASNQIWGSERWLRLFGFAPRVTVRFEEVIQRIHPDDRRMVELGVRRALEDGADYTGECRVILPDGTQHWIAARGRMQPDAYGKPARMLGASMEITDRKHAELEVVQKRSELAHLSRVTMLGELSGSLAHELNQPLTAILSNAEAAQMFLESDAVDLAEIRKILDDIVTADKRAGEIIQRLRSLLKKEEPARHPLEINDVLQEVLKLVRSELVSHGISVELNLTDGLPRIAGDRVQIQQVLINLIINACDAMADNAEGDRKLTVRTDSQGCEVRVAIIDYGCGIPADMLEKVFESFVTTKPAGMGLGLSVCRSIISAHDGRITAENNPDRGACFRVILPSVSGG
jgi:two-component system, LuxR family, sensor kinase FixL